MLTKEDLKNIKRLIEDVINPKFEAFRQEINQRFVEQYEYIHRCFENQNELIKQAYLPRTEFETYKTNIKNAFVLAERSGRQHNKPKSQKKLTSGKIKT